MSGWLPLIIILFAVALVLGPVMWLKPNQRDRRLAKLRGSAAKSGMPVQMLKLPAALGEGTAAVYYNRWGDSRRLQLGWVLELQRMEHDMHFAGRWDWRKGRAAPQPAWEPLRQLLDQLPRDACAIVANENGFGIQWQETGGDSAFSRLEATLNEFRPRIEEAIRQPKPEEVERE
ncbi:hypothetical protein SAMN04487965_0036 [Microbulbifer donghaiensis]|uniref:Preprotein translocase subunit YajC n=1 Tax=Microbulbifer donghaiensis TaxID=494016 RepID=A0A1M4U1E3_9GAMM|nr:hypothetical protein [Microbulbifer donghaiensis]SHE50539.1 hypothetical protein SAMN04487965_0036 [Microbulbifer donghaiensis]